MKKIFVMIVPVILMMLAFRPVTSFTVSGTITDDKGSPVSAVTVIVKGTRTGVTSDNNGVYKIVAAGANSVLVFSSVGYETQEVKLNGRNTINISLKTVVVTTTEVVVTGYGQTKRRMDMGYSNATMNGSPISGRVPGIYVSTKGYIDKDGDGVNDYYAYE